MQIFGLGNIEQIKRELEGSDPLAFLGTPTQCYLILMAVKMGVPAMTITPRMRRELDIWMADAEYKFKASFPCSGEVLEAVDKALKDAEKSPLN